MKILKKIIALCLIILLINILPIVNFISPVDAANPVNLSLIPQPDIDVVLSKAKTSTNLNNFKPDLLNALKDRGVDISKVNISAVETIKNEVSSQDLNVDKIINSWETIGAPTWSAINGKIYSNSPGSAGDWSDNPGVHWTSSNSLSWWGTGLLDPNGYETETVTIDFKMVTGGKLNEGVCFNVTKNADGSLNGYFVTICNHINMECRLWRFDHYTLDQSFASGINRNMWCHPESHSSKRDNASWNVGHTSTFRQDSFTCLAAWSTESSNVPYHIEYKDGNILIKANNSVVVNITDRTYPRGTYGFWGNNCEAGGLMYLNNIRISTITQKVKTLEEVLREPEWREDSIKVLTYVGDQVNEQLNHPTSLGELLTRTINDEIHYVGWGQDVNQSQTLDFIAANNNNGTFINNTDYQNSINETADYIKSLIESKKSSNYVLLTSNTIISSEDDSIMKDTANSEYPYGKWKILHDCEYFENNIGQFAKSGKYISDMIASFNKTGRYEVLYEDRNIQPTYIYVHRKPVAEIEVKRDGDKVELVSLGYDLDNYSNNRGIEEEEWKYRKVGETTWINGKLTDISNGTDYLVQLRVKDFQGTWSAPESKYITKQNIKPIASFKIKNRTASIYEQIEVVDGSYDPYGGTITSRKWTIYKGTSKIFEGSKPIGNYRNYGVGNYKMSLVVTNNRGMTSEAFTRNFTIIPDDEAPEFTAIPINCDWRKSVTVNITFKDRLGSGFKNYQYAITDSQEEPTSWSEPINNMVDNITINQDGIQYLHIKATDNAGNVSESRMVGPYKIDGTPPVAQISNTPTDWVIDYVKIKWEFTDAQSGLDYVILPDGTTTKSIGGEYVVSENGDYTFRAYDKAGNEQVVTQTISNIDKIKPEGVLSLSQTELTDNPIEILWEAVDNQSGVKKVILPDASISEEATGSYPITQMGTYTFIIYDKVGNYREIAIEVNNVDTEKPSLEVTQKVTRWTNEDINLHWKAKDNQSGLKEVVLPNSERTKKEEGDHKVTRNGIYTFLAYDKIGNGIMVKHEVTNIDKEGPFLKLKSEPADNGNVKIIWETLDSQSGFSRIVLPNGQYSTKATGSFLAKQNGVYTFISYDKLGNNTVMKLDINNIDKQGVNFTVWKERINETQYKISWKIEEDTEDFKHILLPNNTYSEEETGYFIVEQEGIYTLLAYDKAGNETKRSVSIISK